MISPIKKGFSIVELMMVMIIVAIIGFLVPSPISYLSQVREAAAARALKADIRYAQNFALTTQQRTWVSFSTTDGTYSLYYKNAQGNWTLMTNPSTQGNYTVNLSTGNFAGVVLSQVNFNGVGNNLSFDDIGDPYSCNSTCASMTLLTAQGSVSFAGGTTVTVEANTGKVS
ncbi:MAG: prepilin-type N-terminal cleavage/methylation domain-containing protein [Candidatus Omnitrophica bacterium]|nr:prepilin-type N-terminal cleavage/methylation domain-containing protein [Candidatus Omnitrophota bacterium]